MWCVRIINLILQVSVYFSITSIYYHNAAFLKTVKSNWTLLSLHIYDCGWAGFWLANVYFRFGVDVDGIVLKYHQCVHIFFFFRGGKKNVFLKVHTYVWPWRPNVGLYNIYFQELQEPQTVKD